MSLNRSTSSAARVAAWPMLLALTIILPLAGAQQPGNSETHATATPQTPKEGPKEKPAAKAAAQTPAQIELLETHFRFEADGSSRKEVHARVRINTELGTRQFARLNFDYNRAYESVEVPMARVTHASGGTEDILPSSVVDQPSKAVVEAPAYQDVRRKTVRILGLQPGDQLEYRVITTTTHAPLAPDFFLFHTFAKDAIVAHEEFELDLPAARDVQLRVNPGTPAKLENKSATGNDARIIRKWEYAWASPEGKADGSNELSAEPDVALTTFTSWTQLSAKLAEKFAPSENIAPEVIAKSEELTKVAKTLTEKIEALYDFASQKIATLDLPFDANGFRTRPPAEILSSGYAAAADKMVLFAAMLHAAKLPATVALAGAPDTAETLLPRPSMFTHALLRTEAEGHAFWLDPVAEVAPFRMIASNFRGKPALLLSQENENGSRWPTVPDEVPFPASQQVTVEAALAADGKLTAKVHYALRGDNELLLRVAFHQTAKEKWKDLAQLLSISDGFRGKVVNVSASEPTETRQPFNINYEIVTPQFVDWNKKPVRIPALLPQIGLPDPPAKTDATAASGATSAIELGTPLDVDTRATLQLPAGTAAHTPTGTSVERDYATFASKYSQQSASITASRRVRFLLREIPAARATDYRAFIHAVQNDAAQDFTLERPATPADEKAPPAVKKSTGE